MQGRTGTSFEQDSMFLVLPVPFRRHGTNLLFESQACNGLNRWADNFSKVVVAAPVMPEVLAQADKTLTWESTALVLNPRITCIPLPWAYGLKDFVREYSACRKLLAEQIRQAEYLQFAIGGLIGDWAAIASKEATKQGRPFAIHTDRVESQLLRKLAKRNSGPRAWKQTVEAWLMGRYEQSVIRQCSIGLWHGQECYAAYSGWCGNNHLIHDVHTKKSDAISDGALAQKIRDIASDDTLRVAYAGRMAEMKAPLEWLQAIAHARDLGVNLSATWYGDGELRSKMEAEIASLKLNSVVHLTGFISDRKLLLEGLRNAQVLLFTHITPESPRILLEAMICGTPIVGYDNAFARDLTAQRGGGAYVPIHDWRGLGQSIADFARDRSGLQRLVNEAASNGSRFNDEELFRERSLIIKTMRA